MLGFKALGFKLVKGTLGFREKGLHAGHVTQAAGWMLAAEDGCRLRLAAGCNGTWGKVL